MGLESAGKGNRESQSAHQGGPVNCRKLKGVSPLSKCFFNRDLYLSSKDYALVGGCISCARHNAMRS